jgi:hypothetical protein
VRMIGKLFVISLLILTTSTKAGPPEPGTDQYKDAIKKCNKAYDDKKAEVELCDLALEETKRIKDDANSQLKEKDDQLNAWYRNPLIWFILGVFGGALVAK